MNPIAHLEALSRGGMDLMKSMMVLLEDHTPAMLAARFGLKRKVITRMRWVHGQLSKTKEQARLNDFSYGMLEAIAAALNGINNPQAHRDECLAILIEHAQGAETTDEAETVFRALVKEWNKDVESHKPDLLYFQNIPGPDGKRRILGSYDATKVARMAAALHPRVEQMRKAAPELPYAAALAQAYYEAICGADEAETPGYGPAFLIAIDNAEQYFADGNIATSDGDLVELREVLNEKLRNTGYAVVVTRGVNEVPTQVALAHLKREGEEPTLGSLIPGVDIARLASRDQRIGMALETLRCVHPDCVLPAVKCQAHHIRSWSRGGKTIQDNLAALCKVHNGENDDDPRPPWLYGRIERDLVTGMPGHRSEPGKPLRFSKHPVVKKGWRQWAADLYGLEPS